METVLNSVYLSDAQSLVLPSLVKQKFDSAAISSSISYYKSSSVTEFEDSSSLSYLIHICPELSSKPGAPPETPNLVDEPEQDPFAAPYRQEETILELKDHVLLLNKNALLREHFMMVRKSFRSQSTNLSPEDLVVAYQIVKAYQDAGEELICFFNGGAYAGASQPHRHLQFAPVPTNIGPERMSRSLPAVVYPTLLPLQYVHFHTTIPHTSSSSNISEEASVVQSALLYKTYSELLEVSNSYLESLPEVELPPEGDKRDSYTLLLSGEKMHLIPRSGQEICIPRAKTLSVSGEQGNLKGEISMILNGLSYAGMFFVGSLEESDDLIDFGPNEGLTRAGYRINANKKV